MVTTSLRTLHHVLPNDPSPRLLRRAHRHLDKANEYGCAIFIREALRAFLLASIDYHEITLKRPKGRSNHELLAALVKGGKVGEGCAEQITYCLRQCDLVCHGQHSRVRIAFVLEMAWWAVDSVPWRRHDVRESGLPDFKPKTMLDDDDESEAWKGGDA